MLELLRIMTALQVSQNEIVYLDQNHVMLLGMASQRLAFEVLSAAEMSATAGDDRWHRQRQRLE